MISVTVRKSRPGQVWKPLCLYLDFWNEKSQLLEWNWNIDNSIFFFWHFGVSVSRAKFSVAKLTKPWRHKEASQCGWFYRLVSFLSWLFFLSKLLLCAKLSWELSHGGGGEGGLKENRACRAKLLHDPLHHACAPPICSVPSRLVFDSAILFLNSFRKKFCPISPHSLETDLV